MVNWHEISRYVRQYQSAANALETRFGIPRDRLDDLPDCRGEDGQQLMAIELADLSDVIEKKRNPPPVLEEQRRARDSALSAPIPPVVADE